MSPQDLEVLLARQTVGGPWYCESESNLTMDGKYGTKFVAAEGQRMIQFSRGNREYVAEARLAAAAVNALPLLLGLWQAELEYEAALDGESRKVAWQKRNQALDGLAEAAEPA